MPNRNLTAANEADVVRLVQDLDAKQRWGIVEFANGRAAADRYIAKLRGLPVSTVRAARYYWMGRK